MGEIRSPGEQRDWGDTGTAPGFNLRAQIPAPGLGFNLGGLWEPEGEQLEKGRPLTLGCPSDNHFLV